MRHLCSVFALSFCLFANAQINITSADMPIAGDTFHLLRDNAPAGFSIGQAGANRTWNFSSLQPDEPVTTYAVAPLSTPYSSDFPNANLSLTNDFSFYLYYRNTATALKVEGFANNDPNLGAVSVNFNPIPDQHKFPATYLTNFTGSSGFVEAKPYNQLPANIQQQIDAAISGFPGASVSQVRVTFTSTYKDTIDAWGTVITPLATYDALRRKRIESSNTKIEAQVSLVFPPTTFWQEVSNTNSNTTEHSWLSAITKIPLISLGYDSLRNINAVTYSTITPPLPPPVAGFTWSNPSGGVADFTNTSQNGTTYLWDFGDGDTSTTENPQHVYLANGNYYVCLAVTNSTDSDIFCDTVRITGIVPVNHAPVAVRDSAHIVYPDTAHFNLLANDYDTDGDNISFELVFSPLNGTVTDLGNGLVDYRANAGFSGIDSFNYKICDDGSPVICDTGTAVVRVDTLTTGGVTSFQKERIRILPNPASTVVRIEIGDWNAEKAEVIDLNGRILISGNSGFNSEEIILDVSTLPQGFYICKLTGGEGKVLAGKLLKQ